MLISCFAGLDRTGMVVALLLDLAGVDRETIEADYAAPPDRPHAPTNSTDPVPRDGSPIREMLAHVSTAYGTTAGYLAWLGLDDPAIEGLRKRLHP